MNPHRYTRTVLSICSLCVQSFFIIHNVFICSLVKTKWKRYRNARDGFCASWNALAALGSPLIGSTACLNCSLFHDAQRRKFFAVAFFFASLFFSIETMLNAYSRMLPLWWNGWTKGTNKWLSIYYAHVQRDKRISYAFDAVRDAHLHFALSPSSISPTLNKQTEQTVRVQHRTSQCIQIEFFCIHSQCTHTLNRNRKVNASS